MGLLKRFICRGCGHTEWAPDNATGRYSVMCGTHQLFLDRDHHRIESIKISHSYYKDDDDIYDEDALAAVNKVIVSGDLFYEPPCGFPRLPWPDTGRCSLEAWNARTGACPRCRGRMEKDVHSMLLVD